ncbi:pyridoxal-phosphate dependent enzyme [Nonomuraea sp. NPDC050663]|uniref:pyridoxal-phosphate dependent enzyme n=1 Tax=Nonomuraea sp. NPDC050663 TaxID=3364370 RepID=UPI003798D337
MYVRPDARDWRCEPAPAGVRDFHRSLPGYAPTPLTGVPAIAAELGLGRVLVKDESQRLGLPAFKVLGASWAIHRAVPAGSRAHLVTATDGNHGRAVARMARLLGHTAEILIPGGVPEEAVAAIEGEGATVRRADGSYDEAVRQAAGVEGAVVVQDTAWPGYEEIPGWIVEGYSTLFSEIDDEVGEPDLVVVPAGVGSLTQAAVTHYRGRPGRTALMTVEPESAACVLASLLAGEPVTVETGFTVMTGLNCGTVSSLAWPYLRDGLDAAVAVGEDDSLRAVRDLGALGISAGPCGAAALAGLRAARRRLDLGPDATVVLLNTEGFVGGAD